MTPERYVITRTIVTPQTRLYTAEPLGVRLTVLIADSAPTVTLMHVTDATEEGAIRRLTAQIVLDFMQGRFCVCPAGLPLGVVFDRVLVALVEARIKRNSDRDRAVHYVSILNDEIGAMRRAAAAAAATPTGEDAAEMHAPEPSPSPEPPPAGDAAHDPAPSREDLIERRQSAMQLPRPPQAVPPQAVPLLSRHRDSDITDGLRPPPAAQWSDGLTGDPLRDAVRRRWQAVAHVGALTAPDGRLILWAANHADLAIKMAKQDRRWWEIGAVGKPTHDFIRDAFDRWVVSREGRRVEAFEQSTIDKIWDPYCRFMISDASAVPPALRFSIELPAPSAEGPAEEEALHHDD